MKSWPTFDSTVGEGVEAELVELTLVLLLELVSVSLRSPWGATLEARALDSVVGRCTVEGHRPSSVDVAMVVAPPRDEARAVDEAVGALRVADQQAMQQGTQHLSPSAFSPGQM